MVFLPRTACGSVMRLCEELLLYGIKIQHMWIEIRTCMLFQWFFYPVQHVDVPRLSEDLLLYGMKIQHMRIEIEIKIKREPVDGGRGPRPFVITLEEDDQREALAAEEHLILAG